MIEIPAPALSRGTESLITAEFFLRHQRSHAEGSGSHATISRLRADYLAKKILNRPIPSDTGPGWNRRADRDRIERGRRTTRNLKVGIFREHGGEPSSVSSAQVGMDYVSCSPFRVPIARLAAAQAAIRGAENKVKKAKPASGTAVKKPVKKVKAAPAKPVKKAKIAATIKKAAPKKAVAGKPAGKNATAKKASVKKQVKKAVPSNKSINKK